MDAFLDHSSAGIGTAEAWVCSACGVVQTVEGSQRRRRRRFDSLGWKERGELALCRECQGSALALEAQLAELRAPQPTA